MLDLSSVKKINSFNHWAAEINQLYHPTGFFDQDSQVVVYSADNLNVTKFAPILLKEWFYLVAVGGYLIIDYRPNKILDWQKLEDQMWWLWRGKYEIIFHGAIDRKETEDLTVDKLSEFIKYHEGYYRRNLDPETLLPKPLSTEMNPKTTDGRLRFVCKKINHTKLAEDSLEKWTFGIVTNGKRKDWLDKIIESIRRQNIPHYEILICGAYFDRKETDLKYLPFNQRDDRGWISKKKNLIVEAAQYENLCIIHDRLFFNNDWYAGMKKWGNCFDHLSCIQDYNGQRMNDWELYEPLPGLDFSFVSLLDYRDWDFNACQGGQLHIAKKTYLRANPWNEAYLWGRAEDLEISNQLRDQGHILRINTLSGLQALLYKFGDLPRVPFDALKLAKRREGKFLRVWGRKLYGFVYKSPLLRKIALMWSKKMKF